MLFYIYSDSTSSTIDITSRCRVGRLSVKDNAEEGSVAISSLIIDDPNGDLEITGHRRMYIYESEAPIHDQVIFNGFVVNERTERGPYRTGAGRQWVVDLADPNVLINRRIMNGADANRPAETDLARIQALLTMTELNTVDDDTYVNTGATTTAMDAVDYRGQNVGAYIDDCRQASGKNGYILYNETVGQYGLWYDFPQSTVYDSACFLTNTIGENNDSTIFLYSEERTYLNSDPSRVASGIYLAYDGGTVYVQDAGTTAAFAAIDWAAPSLNVKSLAKATARANRYLADAATEHHIIHTVMTKVPRSKINKVKKGQLVKFKSSYMTDFSTYTPCRVLYRTVTEISEDPQASFEIEMDLDPLQPTTGYMMSFLQQRDITAYGASIVPRGTDDSGMTYSDPFTYLGGSYVRVVGNYPFDVAYLTAGPAHNQWIWGGVPGLAGTSRPSGRHLILSGATGVPVYLGDYPTTVGYLPVSGTSFWSPTVTAPADGIAFWLLGANGPSDATASLAFVLTGPSGAVVLRDTMASDNPAETAYPRSMLAWVRVTNGQSITFTATDVAFLAEWNSCVVFVPGSGADITEFIHSGSIGGTLSWSW